MALGRAEGSNLGLLRGRVGRDRYGTGLTFHRLKIKRGPFPSPMRPCSLSARLPLGLSSPLVRAPLLHLRNEHISLRVVVKTKCDKLGKALSRELDTDLDITPIAAGT